MKIRFMIIHVIIAILLILMIGSAIGITIQYNGNESMLDGDIVDISNIEVIQWHAPNGELPGTYEEYLQKHSRVSAIFSGSLYVTSNLKGTIAISNISILVDQELYPDILDDLHQYIEDLEHEKEGNTVYVETVQGGTPEEVKNWVSARYYDNCDGIVFIGDITAAWAEVEGSVFPCDLFYMDLDGEWIDLDVDGDYESHTAGTGDMGPEIYVGRIYAHTLDYASEEILVNDYLKKVHTYRTGMLTQPWRGLEYVEEDWYSMNVYLNNIFDENVTRYDSGYHTTGADYLDQLDLGWHSVQVCAHSWSGGHSFGRRPTESASYAHIYVFSPTTRNAKLLLGCNDGIMIWLNGNNVYTNDRYGEWNPDEFEVDVILSSGWNRMLCKISQGAGNYQFSARFTDQAYNSFPNLKYQVNNPDIYGEDEENGFIRSWLVNGFHQDISDNFWSYLNTNYLGVDEGLINPNEGDEMGGFTWDIYNSSTSYIDLNQLSGGSDYGVYYGYVRLTADVLKDCQLWMGYDDGVKVWLNGVEIINDNRYGGFEADMTKVNVTLQTGENRLLVKISEWMGAHGFSARFCYDNGSYVDGLSYEPAPSPINYLGEWLTNGVYFNPYENTRLTTDYLGNETTVQPSEGYAAPEESWMHVIGNGYPFDLNTHYDHGDWVYSSDVQERDSPVLFYNLFACGPGRFTDNNYLAGSYIFNTTYSMISLASSKSGSMLAFSDYTEPLGNGKRFGEAFQEWFDDQAPYEEWEKSWYYGMILFGDPTLAVEPHMEVPFAEFSVEPSHVNISEIIYFNSSSYDYDGYIVNWTWDFDDGMIIYEEHTTHEYGVNGSYTVSLTVIDNDGITDTTYQNIIIGPEGYVDINQSIFDRGFRLMPGWDGAQEFIPSYSNLSSVELYLSKFGSPSGDVTFQICEDSAGGIVVYEGVVSQGDVPSFPDYEWVTVDISDITVTPGNTYYIVLKDATGADTHNCIQWGWCDSYASGSGGPYDGGWFWFRKEGNPTWSPIRDWDFTVRTYGYD